MLGQGYIQQLYLSGQTQFYPLNVPGAQTFYVSPSAYRAAGGGNQAINSANGETPQDPMASIASAHARCVAGRGDTIVLMPGTYTLTTAVSITKSAVRIVALKPYSANITGDGVVTALVKVEADDVELAGLRFQGVAAAVTLIHLADTTAIRNCYIHHCKVIGLETVTGVTGIINGENLAGNDAAHTTIEDCEFEGLSANCIWTFGGGAKIQDCILNLDDTASHTGIRVGDQGGAFATRKSLAILRTKFIGQTDASSLLAVTFAGTEANTQMWVMDDCAFASCAAPTANIHPEGAAGQNYVGTATTTAPTLWPA